jgi:hypothetical protein
MTNDEYILEFPVTFSQKSVIVLFTFEDVLVQEIQINFSSFFT